jgi:hypothetical protein
MQSYRGNSLERSPGARLQGLLIEVLQEVKCPLRRAGFWLHDGQESRGDL